MFVEQFFVPGVAQTPIFAEYAVAPDFGRRTDDPNLFFTPEETRARGIEKHSIAMLVLDPGAALLGDWIRAAPGLHHGIPASNLLGWLVTGAVYSAITLRFVVRGLPPTLASSSLLIIAFWTGVAVGTGLVVPAAIGFDRLYVAWTVLDERTWGRKMERP